jgi:hypothetical protein
VVDIAAGRDYHPLGQVVAFPEVDHLLARDGVDRFDRASDRPPDGILAPNDLVDDLVHQLLRGVLGAANFFDDHGSFLVELGGVDQGIVEHVGEHIEREIGLGARHFCPVIGRLAAGAGVENAADAFDLFRDHLGIRALGGALEEHVLEEMRHTRDFGSLEARTNIEIEDQAGRFDTGHRSGDDADAVIEHGLVIRGGQ